MLKRDIYVAWMQGTHIPRRVAVGKLEKWEHFVLVGINRWIIRD